VNFILNDELKISKMKRIIKLLNKTQNKVVKISVNGKLYDISKISDRGDYAVFELGDFS
jgi:cytochrome b involved in lipid metabolism